MRRLLWLVVIPVTVVACSSPDGLGSLTGVGSPPSNRAVTTFAQQGWLPVGTKVKVGDSISVPPEPYNPVKHGPALAAPTEFENLANRADFVRPPKRWEGAWSVQDLPTPPPGTGDRGFWLYQNSQPWFGVYAVYDVNMSLGLPSAWSSNGVYVYAPTMLPPGGSCVEVTQV